MISAGIDVALVLFDRHGVVARGLEALEPHPLARHAGVQQGALDHVHERPGAAQERLGALEALQRRDHLGRLGQALLGVEVMDHLEPARSGWRSAAAVRRRR